MLLADNQEFPLSKSSENKSNELQKYKWLNIQIERNEDKLF